MTITLKEMLDIKIFSLGLYKKNKINNIIWGTLWENFFKRKISQYQTKI